MNLHINTALVAESFKSAGECPLCEIEREVNGRLAEQFSAEAVMDDGVRTRVNKLGFCREHMKMLYDGPDKLGLALQLQTRERALGALLSGKPKAAKKTAAAIRQALGTCVLCEARDETMERYAETVVRMFDKDPAFRTVFEGSRGFCLPHYAMLLEAGGPAFCEALEALELRNWERLDGELAWFVQKFDHRNADKPWGTSKDAHLRAMWKYQGK